MYGISKEMGLIRNIHCDMNILFARGCFLPEFHVIITVHMYIALVSAC